MGLNMSYTSKVILFVVLVLIGVIFLVAGLHGGEKAEEDALDKQAEEEFQEQVKKEKEFCKKRSKRFKKICEADREERKRKGIVTKKAECPWGPPSESQV